MLEIVRRRPDLASRMVPELPFVLAEAVHAARQEMAFCLEDILRRRIPVMILSRPDQELIARVAALAAPELGWTETRTETEIRETLARWRGLLPEDAGTGKSGIK